jgi:hypothetical protein
VRPQRKRRPAGLFTGERVLRGAAAEFEVFGAEACRVIGDGQADEVAFAAVGKVRRISIEV